ncbi:MAG: hypothetical protein ACI9LO_000236 [Planctomycetota bacterium]
MNFLKRVLLATLFPVLLIAYQPLLAASPKQQVTIADPFIEIHTGPGLGYPLFYVIDRGATVTIIRRRTDWFQIESEDGRTGWAKREQMQQTLLPGGEKLTLQSLTEDDFIQRQWMLGISAGELKAAPVFTIFGSRAFTENLSFEMAYGQSIGRISSSKFWKVNLLMQPLPNPAFSPFFTLGLGKINVEPGSSLIVPGETNNSFAQVGVGIQRYISRSFLLRFEANEYVVLSASTTNDSNEEVNEWKFGFAVFF